MATVDILIPAYNAARFLPAALDSVVAQTYTDWRILLVDDGSTDATRELAAAYKQRLGDRFTYIYQPNAGLPAARNTALRHASAEFLALLDADDVWLPMRLERTLARFKDRPEVGLVYGFIARIDAEGKVLDTFTDRKRHEQGRVAPFLYMRTLHLPCPTVTFRRRCVEDVGFFDESLRATEDRDLWLRIAQRYEVTLVPEIVAHYRLSPQAMTTDGDRMLRAQLQFVNKHYGEPGCGWWARRAALGLIYRQRAEAFALRGNTQAALRSAARALGYYPFHLSNFRTVFSLALRRTGLLPKQALPYRAADSA